MKKTATVFLFLIASNFSFSQNFEEVIQQLYSTNIYEAIGAIDIIITYNVEEAYPHITGLYESKPPIVQRSFLIALQLFNDSVLYDRLIDYINRADDFINEEIPLDPLTEKVHATRLLFSIGQYQTYNYVFELITRDGMENINPDAFNSLDIIMNKIPEAENQARQLLIDLWENSPDIHYRYFSMSALCEKYDTETQSRIISAFQNDDYLPIRILALEYLSNQRYSGLNLLLKSQLKLEPSSAFRSDIADSLLQKFGEPSDLKAVIDYQPNEPDETARSLMRYSIKEFIPPKPDTLGYYDLCIRLISYTEEMFKYNWILNKETRDYYAERLTEVYQSIENTGEISYACSIINERILPQVERDRAEELITSEGYKFLHYYTIYIKEEIEKEYGSCP